MKTVQIEGYAFDCLPGHVAVGARGVGGTIPVAICDAVREMFDSETLKRKRIKNFKLSVVVVNHAD